MRFENFFVYVFGEGGVGGQKKTKFFPEIKRKKENTELEVVFKLSNFFSLILSQLTKNKKIQKNFADP